MYKLYSSYFLVASGLTHFICCGIPFFLGFSSFFTNFFIFNEMDLSFEFFESYENYLYGFTSFIFLTLISIEIYNRRIKKIDCDDVCCEEGVVDSTNKTLRFNIVLSTILFVFNSFFFISEKIS